jgi:hypothetical protein
MEVNNSSLANGYLSQIYNNDFRSLSLSTISKSSGLEFSKNKINNGTIFFESSNITFDNNVVKPKTTHGFELRNNTKNVFFNNNNIDFITTKDCIRSDASSSFRQEKTTCL